MLPRVIVHNAVSVDGRVDWFEPDVGLYYRIASGFGEDATLAGCDTLLRWDDLPEEDASAFGPPEEKPGDNRPVLAVPDSRGRLRIWHALKAAPYWRGFVALCSERTPPDHLDYLRERHIDVISTGDDHVDLTAALEELAERFGVRTVRVDSGGTLNGVLLRAGLVDEVSVLVCPSLVGGLTPASMFRAPDLRSAEGVVETRLLKCEELDGGAVWLRYEVVR